MMKLTKGFNMTIILVIGILLVVIGLIIHVKLRNETELIIGGIYVIEADYKNPFNTDFVTITNIRNGFVLYNIGNGSASIRVDLFKHVYVLHKKPYAK